MGIYVENHIKDLIEQRQRTKMEAIRKIPIYDRAFQIPVRGTSLRCLEYIPSKGGILPVVFDIHGGGFTNGFPEEDDGICRAICDTLGIRVFSLSYRFAPDFPYPEGQMDVYESIAYLASHSAEYGIDTNKMVVMGHSAGGNYALTVAMRALQQGSFSFQGLILDYPPLDIATPASQKFFVEGCIPISLAEMFDACYVTGEQALEPLCSPLYADDETLRKLPPTTILSCEIDSLREEEEQFAARLVRCGVEVTARRFRGQKHAFSVAYDNSAAYEAIDFFIRSIRNYLCMY